MLEETEENKKMFNIVLFDSQESRVNRSQGLKREKEGTSKNLGLIVEQCNSIATYSYSLQNVCGIVLYIHWIVLYILYMVCSL